MSDDWPDLATWAADYRRERAPDALRRRRIQAAVMQRAAAEDRARRVQWIGVAVAAAAVLVAALALGRGLARDTQRDDAGTPHGASHVAPEAKARGTAQTSGTATPRRSTSPSPTISEGVPDPTPRETPDAPASSTWARSPFSVLEGRASEPRPREAGPAPDAPAPAVDLDSLRLLRQAESTLESDPAASLRTLAQHAERFAVSPLALEREALSIIALCRLGREDEGRRRQQQFLRQHGTSAYAARVRRACPATEAP